MRCDPSIFFKAIDDDGDAGNSTGLVTAGVRGDVVGSFQYCSTCMHVKNDQQGKQKGMHCHFEHLSGLILPVFGVLVASFFLFDMLFLTPHAISM